jgi:F-type H+-transporting ATPase subunit delta
MKSNRKNTRAARRLFRLCVRDGVLDEARAREVATRLASSGRRGALPVLAALLRLIRLNLDQRTAVVESAVELPDEVRDRVSGGLTRTYGASLRTTFVVEPALLGGMRVKVGSEVYDGSVRARLARLEAGL